MNSELFSISTPSADCKHHRAIQSSFPLRLRGRIFFGKLYSRFAAFWKLTILLMVLYHSHILCIWRIVWALPGVYFSFLCSIPYRTIYHCQGSREERKFLYFGFSSSASMARRPRWLFRISIGCRAPFVFGAADLHSPRETPSAPLTRAASNYACCRRRNRSACTCHCTVNIFQRHRSMVITFFFEPGLFDIL